MDARIRLLLVDDQDILRRGLKTLLGTKPDLQVVGEADNGQHAIAQLVALQTNTELPDIVLMDIRMPVMDGVEATQRMSEQFPDLKILILTTFSDTEYVAEALRFGAKGYLLKDTPAEELAKAIRSIHQGYTQFGPGILEKVLPQPSTPGPAELEKPPPGLSELTARERDVLRLVATGANNQEIAETLFLSEGTVRNHISSIFRRLDARDRTQAALIASSFPTYLEEPISPDDND
jgi:DNA-binding NarL/FixJ family response regulator